MKKLAILFLLLLCFFNNSVKAQWIQTNGPEGGWVKAFTKCNPYIFAGTNGGGIYRSSNNGINWEACNTGLTNLAIWAFAVKGQDIYSGTNGGVFHSSNNGESWIAINSGLTELRVYSLTIAGNIILAGTFSGGIFSRNISSDYWAPSNTGLTSTNIYSLEAKNSIVYAGTSNGLFISFNEGTTWNPSGLTTQNVFTVISTALHNDIIFAVVNRYGLYKSTDNGINWSPVHLGELPGEINRVLSFNSNLFIAANFGVFRSTDNGENWTQTDSTLYSESLFSSDNYLFAGAFYDEGVFRTSDLGENWFEVNTGIRGTEIRSFLVADEGIYAGSYGGVFFSNNFGDQWNSVNEGLTDKLIYSITKLDSFLFVGSSSGVFRSKDKDITWVSLEESSYWYALSMTTLGNNFFAGTMDKGLFRSTDFGLTWTNVTQNWIAQYTYFSVYSLVQHDTLIFAATNKGIFYGLNSGEEWRHTPGQISFDLQLTCLAFDGTNLLAGTSNSGIYISTDYGNSWSQMNNGLGNLQINSICFAGKNIFVGTNGGGIFLSINNGNEWTEYNDGLKGKTINSLAANDKYLFAAVSQHGVFLRSLSDITSLNDDKNSPETFILKQNYPNPFNASTTISFTLPEKSFVSLKIFDLLGRHVATILSEELLPGHYQQQWNAENISSGIYFYRLIAGKFMLDKKLVLLK